MIGFQLPFSEFVSFCSHKDRTHRISPHSSALKPRNPKLRVAEGLDQHGRCGQGQRHNSLDQHLWILEQHGSVHRDVSRFHGRNLGSLLEACTQDRGLASVRLAIFSSTGSQIGLRSQFQESHFLLEGGTLGRLSQGLWMQGSAAGSWLAVGHISRQGLP